MSKTALWNVTTDDFGSQEIDRDTTRRRAKSLGQWLQDDGATDQHDSHGIDGDPTTERAAPRRPAGDHDRTDPFKARIGLTRRAPEAESRSRVTIDSPDMSLAKAIDAMERRTLRNKRRATAAWEPVSRSRERFDADRDRVSELAERLTEIETHLTDRFEPVEVNPVGATLARLEARLETIGRHTLADAVTLQQSLAQVQRPAHPDSYYRLEEKLDSILAAVRAWPSQSSSIALVASQTARPRDDRDLDDAIGEIARRQKALDAREPISLKQAVQRRAGAHRQPVLADAAPFAAMQREIATLAAKIEGLCHNAAEPRKMAPPDLTFLRSDAAATAKSLRDLARRVDLSSAETAAWTLTEDLDRAAERGFDPESIRSVKAVVADLCKVLADIDLTKEITRATDRLRIVTRKIDDLDRAGIESADVDAIRQLMDHVRSQTESGAAQPPASERIKILIVSLRALMSREPANVESKDIEAGVAEISDLIANPPSGKAFARIEAAIGALDEKFDAAIASAAQPTPPRSTEPPAELDGLLRDLSSKMEAAQAPGADHLAIEELQKQIALLSARFERSDDGLSKLNALQQSMQDLLVHLEQTRASVETSAAEAAREVLRIAIEDGPSHGAEPSAAAFAQIQMMQDEAEARTGSALSAVQETLIKVVDRLEAMETDVAEVRKLKAGTVTNQTVTEQASVQGKAASKDARAISDITSLGAPDLLFDRPLRPTPATTKPAPEPVAFVEPDSERDHADFIAAARRAAKAAQNDIGMVAAEPLDRTKLKSLPRTILIEQSRDYIARHKRPVLLGIAALFVIVGTVAIMERVGLPGNAIQKAWLAPRAQIAATQKSAPRIANAVPTEKAATAVPSMAVHPQASGTDPIQTGSIAPLPVFTAPVTAPPVAPPAIPVKLKNMAEAGDGGAEYVLGMLHAEGRGIPRDFKVAAGWYQKAADQGVVPAQYRLGSLYEKGLGVKQDKAKARSLYLLAAEAGNPRAMHNLAVLLADGDGKPDYSGAATWFRKAAQYGMEDSQFNLAILLARGLGVQQSLVQSYQWFAIAAAQDDADAAKKREEVGSKLSAADLAVAKTLAATFRPRTVALAATEVQPPPGGWDGASAASPVNSVKKLSSL